LGVGMPADVVYCNSILGQNRTRHSASFMFGFFVLNVGDFTLLGPIVWVSVGSPGLLVKEPRKCDVSSTSEDKVEKPLNLIKL